VLRQICNLIPNDLVPKLARETGVDKKARTFSPWSHLVSLIYAQLTHAIGLNDICDGLRLLWRRWDMASLLQSYWTASGSFRFIATPQEPCFQRF